MKILISAFLLTMSFITAVDVQAADKKIGNLIAVERSIDNIYNTCADQFTAPTTDSSFFSCKFDAKKNSADITPAAQRLLSLSTPTCEVDGYVQNSVVLVLIQIKSTHVNQASAKACLQQALDASKNKDSFKFIMYTIE